MSFPFESTFKIIIIVIFSIGSLVSNGQSYYTFSHNQEDFIPLVQDKQIFSDTNVFLNFEIPLYSDFFTDFSIRNQSMIKNNSGRVILSAFGFDNQLVDRSWVSDDSTIVEPKSRISYKIDGNIHNRIFKIQYSNFKLKKSSQFDSISFQIWLYESEDMVQFRYGPLNVSDNQIFNPDSLRVGIAYVNLSGSIKRYNFLSGSAQDPIMREADVALSTPPKEGQVYTFKKAYAGVEALIDERILVYPNPFNNRLIAKSSISNSIMHIDLIDLTGKKITESDNFELIMNTSDIVDGTYLLRITTPKGIYSKKVVKFD